jgi:hypothetical protein
VPDRAAQYISERTWRQIRRHRRRRNCTAPARLARRILDGKTALHKHVGKLFGYLIGLLEGSPIARMFAEKLAAKIPIPILDQKATIAARGLQLAGIFFCYTQDRPLKQCACFIDVFDIEGPERIKQLLTAAASDWATPHHLTTASDAQLPWPIGRPSP